MKLKFVVFSRWYARWNGVRSIVSHPSSSRVFARCWIQSVTSVPAGPPWGGLYLKPPSDGGLWLGVMTIPSAIPCAAACSRLWVRIACEMTGVGVYPSRSSIMAGTAFAASTSIVVRNAGSDSACVSRPTKIGPVYPWARR